MTTTDRAETATRVSRSKRALELPRTISVGKVSAGADRQGHDGERRAGDAGVA
ncbi:hypothetical protein [Rhizobium sp. M1]|uniref:hypothetical protein n=1 Tax=Rhizobium sp. M1 TaxID=2035453 RepID=UPI0015969F8C|nr:hypothetical protein [Rhizobium sp. M1]